MSNRFILFIIVSILTLISCEKSSKIEFLSQIALKYYDSEMSDKNVKKFFNDIQSKRMIIFVEQQKDYNDFEVYNIFFYSTLSEEPNYLINKRSNIYIAIFLNNSKERAEVPESLKQGDVEFLDETSLTLVVCKKTRSYKLIKRYESLDLKYLKNLDSFSCKDKNKNPLIEGALIQENIPMPGR